MVEVWLVETMYDFGIERVMADRVTELSVIIDGRRKAMVSDGRQYFESFDEAQGFAADLLNKRYLRLQSDMAANRKTLRDIQKLTADILRGKCAE